MEPAGITVDGLKELRSACRAAGSGLSREIPKALRVAGKAPLDRVKILAGATTHSSRSTGDLLKSYSIRTSGTSAYLRSGVPYGAGAEWGLYGKWSGFRKYAGIEAGGRGRFAWRAVQEERDTIADLLTKALESLIEINGWATP